jgi:hypothetical protein
MFAPAQQEFRAGQQLQNFAQGTLGADVNKFNYYQNLPYQQLQSYLNSIGGNYGQAQTQNTASPYYVNQGANLLSGALGIGALGNMAIPGGLSSLFGGTAAGLAGGAAVPAAVSSGTSALDALIPMLLAA